jgi:glycosyltransferase involved in cell wall biosynthesis
MMEGTVRKRPWSLRVAGENRVELEFAEDPERVRISFHRLAATANYDIQLNCTRYEVTGQHNYRLTFRGRADDLRDVCVGFAKASEPWSNLGLYRRLQLTTDWQDFSSDFVAASDDDNARIHFDLADAPISVELSSVRLWRITDAGPVAVERLTTRPVWRATAQAAEAPEFADSPSWVRSAPNPTDARTLASFRMFGVLGTWMEEDVVAATIRNAIAQGCERVYLVDNGSDDGTVEAASREGAVVARTFHTSRYDEALRLRHMNDVVIEVSQQEGDDHIWWLFLDADEFHHGPWGMTLREYLATLDGQFRVVGTRFFNHYPSGMPYYEQGRHPLDFQPLCEELAFPMCPARHRKHPLQRYDRGGASIVCGNGFHDASCKEQLYEPAQPAFLHHFPFRDEAVTRRRLEALWEKDHAGVTRALESRDTHILTRFRSMDAVYSQDWAKVENFIALDPLNEVVNEPAAGVNPRPWSEMVDHWHQPVLRWYSPPMVGAWKYENVEKFQYGDDVTYKRGMMFLDGQGAIEDWGCGFAHAKAFVNESLYVGIDGSSKWADRIADLTEYRSDAECIFMRHVLEHNVEWKRILANAVSSFRKRMALILFTPFSNTTHVIATSKTVTSFSIPDISFRKEDLTAYFEHLKYTEESLETDTQYGIEHVFYIEK